MPPEPLPWDRKELFRERKHGGGGGAHDPVGGGPTVARWRDTGGGGGSHHRWGFSSEFRRPPGHGKQGGWHMYPEDSPHGYPTARSGERFLDDDGFRPSMPRGDGRYGRFYRENRASFGQKEWRGHSWENNHHHGVPPSTPGRPHFVNDHRSVGDSPMRAHPLSDPCDQSKDQADKMSDVNGPGTGQKVDKENSLGSLDWKPLKWSRSGSLTSRGSGFSHSSSSKSTGGESNDVKVDLPPKIVSPIQSPSGDAAACAPSTAPSDETISRKKPRLGWGEGLAKYEKKKVEGPDENTSKVANAVEPTQSLISPLADKSPRVTGFSDCSSPATPSSVACSSSPGLEDKVYAKSTDADGDANNFCVSSMPVAEYQLEGSHFSLEKLELTSITNLSSLLNELLQADDQYSSDSGFVKSSALNKLLLWKSDISKELEITETEIDSLEIELKSLKSDSEGKGACPASLNSLPTDCKGEACDDANMILRPPPLEVVSSGDVTAGEALPLPCDDTRGAHTHNMDVDPDSPGTATSKLVEQPDTQNSVSTGGLKHCSTECTNLAPSTRTVTQISDMHTDVGDVVGASYRGDDGKLIDVDNSDQDVCDRKDSNICDTVFASNKESAVRASEVLLKLLPSGDGDCCVDSVESNRALSLTADPTIIREKFLKRKQLLKFKEKVMALKYRAFQHLWKEDLRLLSLKSHRTKLQKKNDLSSRTMQGLNQKHRSSIRSRFSSPAGSLSLVPTAEVLNFTAKLLSDSEVKVYRSSLKMPAMVVDEKEKMLARFVSSNGLVEDPCTVEKERALINPWTDEEKEIFMDMLATHGKDFSKIASFLDHKTTADCIEFYYKNHKSECFQRTKKKPELKKQGKPLSSNTYLVTSGKRWGREMNAASLDILGAASVIAAQADEDMEPSKLLSGKSSNRKSRGSDVICEASSSYYVAEDERETTAADVLAGICGSLSSEAMSSCITSSVDPGEGNQDLKHQKVGYSNRRPLTPEVTQNVEEDTYSDESCGEMDPIDWTDDEKSLFVQAFSSYGKDFLMISRCVRTKSRDQCKVFFSKARKCLGLDGIQPGSGMVCVDASNDTNGGGSDAEEACIVETGSVVCSDKSGSRIDEDLPNISQDVSKPEAVNELNTLEDNCVPGPTDCKDVDTMHKDLLPVDQQAEASVAACDGMEVDVQNSRSALADNTPSGGSQLVADNDLSTVEPSMGVIATEPGPVASSVSVGSIEGVGLADVKSTGNFENGSIVSSSRSDIAGSIDGWREMSTAGDNLHCLPPSGSTMIQSGSSQSMKNSPLDLSTKAEWDVTGPSRVRSKSEGPSFQNFYLRKCNQAPLQNAVAEFPFLVKREGQCNNHAGPSCSSKAEKPSGNGDVKLFGKILSKPAAADKPTVGAQENDDMVKHPNAGGKLDMNGNSTSGKHDHDSFLGLENVPIRSYGFWDGTKIQTGFSALPDSALLLAKYPTAFANYTISSSKTEQQPLQSTVNANECNMNGACVFSPREFSSSSNGSVVEYPVYRNQEGVHPFRLDLKQRQDAFSEVQRNGFEGMSGLQQQQGKGLVTLNVVQGGGDILVGGTCTGISDPVAALKLHYARTQQYGGVNGGNGMIREESWRGQGDVGR